MIYVIPICASITVLVAMLIGSGYCRARWGERLIYVESSELPALVRQDYHGPDGIESRWHRYTPLGTATQWGTRYVEVRDDSTGELILTLPGLVGLSVKRKDIRFISSGVATTQSPIP